MLAGAGAVGRDRAELLGGRPVDLATALLRRDAIKDVGGFDESLGGSVERDLMLRLSRDHDPLPVDVPVLKRPDPGPHDLGDDWDSVVLERQLVDWDAAAAATTVRRTWSPTSCRSAPSPAVRSSGSARCPVRARS